MVQLCPLQPAKQPWHQITQDLTLSDLEGPQNMTELSNLQLLTHVSHCCVLESGANRP